MYLSHYIFCIILTPFLSTDGYAFSQEEHGVIGQSEVIRAYDTTQPKPGGM